jgi:predicted  nucleic acid-binding Zn-ribbon protein
MSEAGSNDAMDTDAASVYVLITPQEFERLRNSPNDLVALCDEQHLKLLTMEREIANDKISTLKKETETLKSQIQSGEEHSASVLNAVEQKSIRIREERDAVINRNEVLEQKIKSLGM